MKTEKRFSLEDFAKTLGVDSKEMIRISQNINDYYRIWYKKKSDGSKREITEPKKPLRTIQEIMLEKISFYVSPQAHGGVKERSIRTNALVHRQSKYLITVDIKNAYPTVDSKMVYWLFREMKASAQLARILTRLTTFRGRLPQGTPTSLAIFNALLGATNLLNIDARFSQGKISGHPLRYSRYVDDLTFSANVKIPKNFESLVSERLKEVGFSINPKKTRYGSRKNGSMRITGVNIIDKQAKLPPKQVKRFRGMIGRAIMDGSVSENKVFGIIAYAMGIEKKIPNQLLNPLLGYLEKRPDIKCPAGIRKQINKQLKK